MPNRLRVKKIHRVSLVNRGDDPEAQVVLVKSEDDDMEKAGMYGESNGDGKGCPGPSKCAKRKPGEKYCASCPLRKMTKEEVVSDDNIDHGIVETDSSRDEGANVSDEFLLPSETPEVVVEYVKSLEDRIFDLEDDIRSLVSDDDDATEDDLMKSAPEEFQAIFKAQQAELALAREQAAAAEEIAKAERDARMEREFIAKAEAMPHVSTETSSLASLLRKIAEAAPEEFEALEAILVSADRAIADSELFKQASNTKPFANSSAYDKVVTKAQEMRVVDPGLTIEAAIAKVAMTDQALYREYLAEKKER